MNATLTLLIVDDNARVRATIGSVLAPLAARIVEGADGLEAVQLYESLRPDWVLLDVSMPKLDGISTAARIHAIDPHARIVIVTNYASVQLQDAARAAGAAAYVTKDELFRLLEIIGAPP